MKRPSSPCLKKPARSGGGGGGSWKRNLFEKTGLPDNYTPDDCFLAAIQRNKNVVKHSLSQCILSACQVSLQLNALFLFLFAYLCLARGSLRPDSLALLAGSLASLGYLAFYNVRLDPRTLVQDLKHVLVFGAFGLGLSPVLHRLTDTVSTDTIYTTSLCMLLLHLLFHNYDPRRRDASSPNALSLNAALFASVCLASRLHSSWDALVLLMISVIAFVLFPMARLGLGSDSPPTLVPALTLGGSAASFGLAYLFSGWIVASAVLGILVFVTLVAPGLFVRWQNHKDTIHGPWDEAVPKIK